MKSSGPKGGRRPRDPRKQILILGTDEHAWELSERLTARDPAIRIVGHVHLEAGTPPAMDPGPVFPLAELAALLRDRPIDEVLALSPDSGPAVAICTAAGIPLTFVSELPGGAGEPAAAGTRDRSAGSAFRLGLKRALDIAGAALGLVLAAPVLALSALALQLASPGPVVSRQTRCGLHGRRFTLCRLRTEETWPARWRGARRTRSRVGRFVHESGVDDVLVLWNVLKGDMSLVGPRPTLPSEVARSADAAHRRLSMRPGLTCTWQLTRQAKLADDECAKLELQYVEGWSLRTDLKILARTVPAVLRGACH